jgi:type I restriction enzyme, R subunit
MPGPHDERTFETGVVHEVTTLAGWDEQPASVFDRDLRFVPDDLGAFLTATQPEKVEQLEQRLGDGWLRKTAAIITDAMKQPGATLKYLREGKEVHGVHLDLAYFKPTSSRNPALVERYEANVLTVIRQVPYAPDHHNTVDLGLFVNGFPVASAELKNGVSQTVGNAVDQYQRDRDPRDAFLSRRCVVHFAADPYLVQMTTTLQRSETAFLPFNRGSSPDGRGGAGNWQPADGSHPTSYLWRDVWQRDNWLDLVQRFVHVEHPDPDEPLKDPTLIFPRYHQWECVRRFVADARDHGAGRNLLAMHSTGSGKTNTIGWLAHRLANLFMDDDTKVFDKVVVITDRRVLDRQLQDKIEQFEKANAVGMVRSIKESSEQLREALESRTAKIIITTIQKFPYITETLDRRVGSRFAVIIDEAHSSQTGESAASLKRALSARSEQDVSEEEMLAIAAEDAAAYDAEADDPAAAMAEQAAAARGRQDNLSMFAFTATPKNKTLEMFGEWDEQAGTWRPSHLYSMRQAIEEKFILNILENYVTYQTYYRLATKAAEYESEEVERSKALAAARRYAQLHPYQLAQKAEVIVEHFREHVQAGLDGHAKAMVVTASRLHAVRYKKAIDRYLAKQGYDDLQALIAFSGEVLDPDDPGEAYTEASMNGFTDKKTEDRFDSDDYQVMVVAEKYQTGFDQPKLCAMYVDKKLSGINAVQTLSRLNRTYPGKVTFVLDFVNEIATIEDAYSGYWDEAIAEPTDPQVMYETWERLDGYHIVDPDDVDRFAAAWFDPEFDPLAKGARAGARHAELNQQVLLAVAPAKDRFDELDEDTQDEFRQVINQFVRMYAFVSQIIPWADETMERRHAYCRLLRQRIKKDRGASLDLSDELEMTHFHMEESFRGGLDVHETETLPPAFTGGGFGPLTEDEQLALLDIIEQINERYGTNWGEEHRLFVEAQTARMVDDPDVQEKFAANNREKARIVFGELWQGAKFGSLDEHTELVKSLVDNPEVERMLGDAVFEAVYREARKRAESE